jgi:phosphoribosylformimino-5-aminoimidazole carboxamide ribotide isomerase
MILYPAIDLKGGECVRLEKGVMDAATVFNRDPVAQAESFAADGATYLHIVDLDGAFAAKSVNGEVIEAIAKAVRIKIQLGGGIRSIEAIEAWLDRGISRCILGTVALKDPKLVREACRRFPRKIAIGIDARDGMVAVEGWAETSTTRALDLARRLEDAGAAALIYTDIDRDGMMSGANVDATKALADAVSTPIIASGGVSSLDDLATLRGRIPNLNGVISGRALYDGRIQLKAALELLKGEIC